MTQTLLRFVLGGAIVASLPLIAERFGPTITGLAVLFPAVTLAGFLVLGQAQGLDAVAATSVRACFGLPTVAAFLLVVHLTARNGVPLPFVLLAGVGGWLLAAVPIGGWLERRQT